MTISTEQQNGIPEELAPDEDAKGRSIIEAVLTASDEPVSAGKLAELVGDKVGAKEVREYIDALNEVYVQTGRAFRITEVAGGFQFSVHHEFAPWIRRLFQEKPVRLSQAALEVLSIVAFKQPITKAEVEHIRGVASDGVLRHLMEKGLVRIAGRSDAVGRPLLYGTARDFLKFFGLKTLADLPKVREVEDLLREEAEGSVEGEGGEGAEIVSEGTGLTANGESEAPEDGESTTRDAVTDEEDVVSDEEDVTQENALSNGSDLAETNGEVEVSEDVEPVTEDAEADTEVAGADADEAQAGNEDVAETDGEEVESGETEQISGEGRDRLEESV